LSSKTIQNERKYQTTAYKIVHIHPIVHANIIFISFVQ